MLIRKTGFWGVWMAILFGYLMTCQNAQAEAAIDVALAGFAYSGSENTIASRFPYSKRYEDEQQAAGAPIGQQLFRALAETPANHLRIVPQIAELKGRTQALAVALAGC